MVLLALTSWVFAASSHAGIAADAVSCLGEKQAVDGSWGDIDGSALRDTTVVIDALTKIGEGADEVSGALTFAGGATPNHDYLARQIASQIHGGQSVPQAALDELLAGQASEVTNPASSSYPGGGWGVAPGFDSDVLTTALALRALVLAGFRTGLSVTEGVVPAGGDASHSLTLPAGASDFVLLVREISGAVRLWVDPPVGGSLFLDLADVGFPIEVGGLPVDEGDYTIRVESVAGGPHVYSMEARFVDAGGIDSSLVSRTASYLGFRQNLDGSWGARHGAPGTLMVTSEVVAALQRLGPAFAPQTALTDAALWLSAFQNPDGGFGTEPGVSTAYETALALRAIQAADPDSSVADTAISFLVGTQEAAGCWNDDAYSTGAVLLALAPTLVCRSDVDRNAVVDVPTDIVYLARALLGLSPVPPAFRLIDPTIPPDADIAAAIASAGARFDVDGSGAIDVPTDVVYVARHLLGLPPVPPAFRTVDPTIPSDAEIGARVDALCP